MASPRTLQEHEAHRRQASASFWLSPQQIIPALLASQRASPATPSPLTPSLLVDSYLVSLIAIPGHGFRGAVCRLCPGHTEVCVAWHLDASHTLLLGKHQPSNKVLFELRLGGEVPGTMMTCQNGFAEACAMERARQDALSLALLLGSDGCDASRTRL